MCRIQNRNGGNSLVPNFKMTKYLHTHKNSDKLMTGTLKIQQVNGYLHTFMLTGG